VQFNLSHSADVALIGFAEDCEIGVDVEKIRPITDALDIAGRFFSAEERAELMSLPESEQQRAFFRCWTRKEAYLKATGDGLGTDLASFRVSVLPFEPARVIHINGSSDAGTRWSLHSVDFYPDCEAALAYAGSARDVRVLELMTVSTNKS
jgi:4'-phosphopantetheinyl transferase